MRDARCDSLRCINFALTFYRLMPFNFYTRYVSLWVMGLFIALLVSPFDVMVFSPSFFVCLFIFVCFLSLFNLFLLSPFSKSSFFVLGAKKVLDERVYHIAYVPTTPEPYYHFTGQEIQPRPVGEENGAVVFYYNPISAVNYVSVVLDDFFYAVPCFCSKHFSHFGSYLWLVCNTLK